MKILSLFRPVTSLIASLSSLMGIVIGSGYNFLNYLYESFLVFFVTLIFCFGGFALNDYYDRDIDKISHPNRPIPAGIISPKKAYMLGFLLLLISISLSFFINLFCLLLTIFTFILILSYEKFLKMFPIGNVIIALLASITFLFGGMAIYQIEKPLFLSIMVFFMILGREILMDIEDIEGDINRKTLPKIIGKEKAKIFSYIFIGIAISMSPLPYFMGLLSKYYLFIVILADIIFIFAVLKNYMLRELTKAGMLLSLLAFIIGVFIK